MGKGLYLLVLLICGSAPCGAQKPVFDHLAVYVSDLPKSTAFYRDVVGLDTLPEPFRDGRHTWLSLGPGAQLHLIAGAARTSDHLIDNHLALRIPSVDAFVARLEQKEIAYVNARGVKNTVTLRPDGVKQVYFQDPDGYWIEVNDAKK